MLKLGNTVTGAEASSTGDLGMSKEVDSDGDGSEIYGGSRKGGKQWNEDSFAFFEAPGHVSAGAIFDGHGGFNGKIASETCAQYFKEWMESQIEEMQEWKPEQWKEKLRELFTTLHTTIREAFLAESRAKKLGWVVDDRGIVRATTGDPVHGGTTGTVTIKSRDREGDYLVTANVGDSAGVVVEKHTKKGTKKWEFLTVDHGPESQEEYHRVASLPKEEHPFKLMFVYDKMTVLRKYECPLVFNPDGTRDQSFTANPWGNGLHPTNVRYEPAVYAVTPQTIGKDSTCIAMTRALGDFYAHQFGLTFEPSVQIHKLPKNGEFAILLASDGIWDCWKYDDFAELVKDCYSAGKSTSAVGEQILEESVSRAISNFGAKHFDDASLVLWCRRDAKSKDKATKKK